MTTLLVCALFLSRAVFSALGNRPERLFADGDVAKSPFLHKAVDVLVSAQNGDIFDLLEAVNPRSSKVLQNVKAVVDEYDNLKGTLQCESLLHCTHSNVDPVAIASGVLQFASVVCKYVPVFGLAVPILDKLNAILRKSSASDPPLVLESLAVQLSDRIDKSVREMQTFHVERDIADAKVQATVLDDVRAEIPEETCSDKLLDSVYRADAGASLEMIRLLERAELLNRAPLIQQAVDGKVKDTSAMLDLIILGGSYYRAWHVVANSRFQLLSAATARYHTCAADGSSDASMYQDLQAHLNVTLLQRSATRFETSVARETWKEKGGAISDHLMSMFSSQVLISSHHLFSGCCDVDKYTSYTEASDAGADPVLVVLATFVPEKCAEVSRVVSEVAQKCRYECHQSVATQVKREEFHERLADVCGNSQLTTDVLTWNSNIRLVH